MYKKNVKDALDALAQTLVSLGANPFRIDLPRPPGVMKVGADDFLLSHGAKAKKMFAALTKHPMFISDGINAAELLNIQFKEPSWIVDNFISEGLTIFAGKPKIGKSWLVLQLATNIASGKPALNHFPIQRRVPVAYLALEDNHRRLQKRLLELGATKEDVNDLHLYCEWPQAKQGGLLALERWLQQNSECRIVFIDTLARFRGEPKTNNSYYEDYAAIADLKKLADQFKVSIFLVHHLRKQGADDPFEAISGTNGIAGAADTNIVLTRDRKSDEGVLHITGRDIPDEELALSFKDGIWAVVGKASKVNVTKTQNEILLLLHETGEPMTPTAIARETGKKVGGLSKTLRRMRQEGLIEKVGKGEYQPKLSQGEKKEKYRRE